MAPRDSRGLSAQRAFGQAVVTYARPPRPSSPPPRAAYTRLVKEGYSSDCVHTVVFLRTRNLVPGYPGIRLRVIGVAGRNIVYRIVS